MVIKDVYLSVHKWNGNPVEIEQSPTCASILIHFLHKHVGVIQGETRVIQKYRVGQKVRTRV